MENILYLLTFKDDSANFYQEDVMGNLKPLFETNKMIDSGKIIEKCSVAFSNGILDCDTLIIVNGKPEKVYVKKIFPSNLEGRSRFFNLLEEHTSNYGGSIFYGKLRKSGKKYRRGKSKGNSKRKSRKNKTRRYRKK